MSDEYDVFGDDPVPYARRFARKKPGQDGSPIERAMTLARSQHAPYSRSNRSRDRADIKDQHLRAHDLKPKTPRPQDVADPPVQPEPAIIIPDPEPLPADTAPPAPAPKRRKRLIVKRAQPGSRQVLDHRRLPGGSGEKTT